MPSNRAENSVRRGCGDEILFLLLLSLVRLVSSRSDCVLQHVRHRFYHLDATLAAAQLLRLEHNLQRAGEDRNRVPQATRSLR